MPVDLICIVCGASFRRPPSHAAVQKTCSKRCGYAYRLNGKTIQHGQGRRGKQTKEFRAWLAMKSRCKRHPHYLRMGTTVCPEWEKSFEIFFAELGMAPTPAHELDRWPNPDGNYESGNVRWATKKQQRANW